LKTKNDTIPAIDLFAGAGGLGEGFPLLMLKRLGYSWLIFSKQKL